MLKSNLFSNSSKVLSNQNVKGDKDLDLDLDAKKMLKDKPSSSHSPVPNTQYNTNFPTIFKKKVNYKYNTTSFNEMPNNLGKTKYFTPASLEWFNSIYTFNKSYIRSLPFMDKRLLIACKSYLTANIKTFNFKDLTLNNYSYLSRIQKRLSFNKVFVGKGNVKHYSENVMVTLYIYNYEKNFLFKRSLNFYELKYLDALKTLKRRYFVSDLLNATNSKYKDILHNYYLFKYNKFIENYLSNDNLNIFKDKLSIEQIKNQYFIYIKKVHLKKKIEVLLYKYLYEFNKSKFKKNFLTGLSTLVKNLYGKKVIFNIVTLNKIYHSNDIFSQAIFLRLSKPRANRKRAISLALRKFKVSKFLTSKSTTESLVNYQYSNNFIVNSTYNNKINDLINNSFNGKDPLNNLILNLYKISEKGNKKANYLFNREDNYNYLLNKYVLNTTKYKHISGIRLKLKGRLSRRHTASRSITWLRSMGAINSKDTKYKGLSTVVLRGNTQPNVKYSMRPGITPNGAYGFKGWIGSV